MTASGLRAFLSLAVVSLASWGSTACSNEKIAPAAPAAAVDDAGAAGTQTAGALDFVADYPATLLYALDGAAGVKKHDPSYRTWLLGDENPKWLSDYAARRDAWGRRQRPDPGGGAPTFEVCGWTSTTLDEAKTCLEDVVPAADHAILAKALEEIDLRLRPKWPAIAARFATLMPELDVALASDSAAELLRLLRKEAAIPDATKLRFRIVLVGKPPSDHTFARQSGEYLVHEVGEDATAGGLLGVAFHELAHLAHARSPERSAFERSFLPLGDSGKLAANVWDEVVATAFGNGLAAEVFDPDFRVERSFYADEWIDTLGRALYLEWKAGRDVRLGPDLAKDLARLVDAKWPIDKRPVSRFLWYLTVSAEEQATLEHALDGINVRSAYRFWPIDDTISAPPDLQPWAVRVVLATVDDLIAHPALITRVAMPDDSWTSALEGHHAGVFRRTDPDGTMLLVIVARDKATLGSAMPDLAARPRMVDDGWTAW